MRSVPVSVVALCALPIFLAPSGCDSPECGDIVEPAPLADAADVSSRLVGKWNKCGGGRAESLASPFEFASDGTWHLLRERDDGSTVRLDGPGQTGTWEVDPSWTAGLKARIFVYFNNAPGSSSLPELTFMTSPRRMKYDSGLYNPRP